MWGLVLTAFNSRFEPIFEYWSLLQKATDANVGNIREHIQKLKTMPTKRSSENDSPDGPPSDDDKKTNSEFYDVEKSSESSD